MNMKANVIGLGLLMACAVLCLSCDSAEPEPCPEPIYPLGMESQQVEWMAGEVSFNLDWETSDRKLPMVFLREDKPLYDGEFYQFEHRQYDLGGIFGGMDVMTYCLQMGVDEYPATEDFYVPYQWIEVASFQADLAMTKVVVRYGENPNVEPRDMFIHFFNGKWGLVHIGQKGKPSE